MTAEVSSVLVTDGLDEGALESLRAHMEVIAQQVSPEELLKMVETFDALIVRSRTKVTREVIERGKRLKVIARAGVGVDNIDLQAATAHGIRVVNAPTASTESVAELTVGLMLSLARRIPQADQSMKDGLWEKSRLKGGELEGKVLGLVGSGRIGGRVADICRSLGMRVIAYDPYLSKEAAEDRGVTLTDLDTLLQESDYVSVHAALTEETRHMISHAQLAMMKRTAYLVNCARGAIVEEEALVAALQDDGIAGAGLDVYEEEPPKGSPLLSLENVVLTPHIAASTREAQQKAGLTVADQVLRVLRGETPEFLVNKEVLRA